MLSHTDKKGRARMVDVGSKEETERVAVAACTVSMSKNAISSIMKNENVKGDVLTVAKLAGIMAAKRTGEMIPLAHTIKLTNVEVEFTIKEEEKEIDIRSTVKSYGKTGVEMEALTAAASSALTLYDMCKAVDRSMVISNLRLLEKKGGKSGHWVRAGARKRSKK
ncbi:MAG: cyclic pyranopterin monophosphate synthase MoaC [bacterium]